MGKCFSKCTSREQIYQYKIQVSEVAKHYHKQLLNIDDSHTTPLEFRVAIRNFRGRSLAKVPAELNPP